MTFNKRCLIDKVDFFPASETGGFTGNKRKMAEAENVWIDVCDKRDIH